MAVARLLIDLAGYRIERLPCVPLAFAITTPSQPSSLALYDPKARRWHPQAFQPNTAAFPPVVRQALEDALS